MTGPMASTTSTPPENSETVAIYALTVAGADLAGKIAAGLERADVFLPQRLAEPGYGHTFDRLVSALAEHFKRYDGHIVIAAAGIVVRALAPLLEHKAVDPGVVVVDQAGRYAVSLVGGHLGGANQLAEQVAEILGGRAVITTATDTMGKPGLDVIARDLGLDMENPSALARIGRMIVEGDPVPVYDPAGWLWPALAPWPYAFVPCATPPDAGDDRPLVWVGAAVMDFPSSWLLLRPRVLAVGMGCNRGTSEDELLGLLLDVFAEHNLSPRAINRLATIRAKQDEPGLLALAGGLNRPIEFYDADELQRVSVPNPSSTVEHHMGVKSVCEAAALLAARSDRLLVTKKKSANATLAAAICYTSSE